MNFETSFIVILKIYGPIVLAALFGAVAHAFEEVKRVGWKGWFSFLSDVVVCSFVGYSFFHLAQFIYPEAAIFFTSIGSYWGTKGFVVIKNYFLSFLKTVTKTPLQDQ